MDILDNIIRTLKLQNKKQSELTQYLGLNKTAFSNWKSGQSNSYIKHLPQIAEFLGVSIDDLAGNEKQSDPPQFTASDINTDITYVPLYESVSAGCGVYADSVPVGYVPIMAMDDSRQYFSVKVKGDSMSPRIENGDIIIVRRQETAEDGQVAVVMVEDEGFVKRVFFGKNRFTLKSYNRDYDDRVYTDEELNDIRICGVVVQVIKMF